MGKFLEAETVGNGRGIASADDSRAEREVQFIHEADAEEGVIEFAAAFAKETLHVPFAVEPCERGADVEFRFAENFYFIGEGAELFQLLCASFLRGDDDDGGLGS